jgi:hypothetical protein
MDLRGDNVVIKGNAFSFDIPSVKGNYQGMLSADGRSLNGTWSQGILLPLDLTRRGRFIWAAVGVSWVD